MLGRILMIFTPCVVLIAQSKPGDARAARDLAAIQALHARDEAAAKASDVAALADLWTADAVALPPGEEPVIGIGAIRAWLAKGRVDTSKLEIVEYAMDFKEVRVLGDEAYEWARTHVTVRPKGAPAGMRASGNLMRVLKRQPDGSWKVARAAWNLEPPAPEKPASR